MQTGRHRIIVRAYPAGTRLYAFTADGSHCLNIIGLDPNHPSLLIQPSVVLDTCDELIHTSQPIDVYGNKDCFHSFHEADITLDISAIPDISIRLAGLTAGPMYNMYKGRGFFATFYAAGCGTPGSRGYTLIKESTSSSYVKESHYLDGVLNSTDTISIVSVDAPLGYLEPFTVSFRTTRTFSEESLTRGGSHDYDWDRIETRSTGCGYLGTTQSPLISITELLSEAAESNPLKQGFHFVPDNIIDKVYEKLTIPDVNNIENLKDLKEIRKSMPPIVNVLKKRSFRSFSDFYLWYKYSYSTSMLDLKAYYEFFQNWLKQSSSKSDRKRTSLMFTETISGPVSSETVVTRYQIISDPFNIGVLQALGLEINLTNTWDLLPFSFVVDWFINLGDILARIDHSDVVSKMKIRSVITSTKRTSISQPFLAHKCLSSYYGNYYYRSIDHVLPLGKLEVNLKNPGTHLIDGTALIVSKR